MAQGRRSEVAELVEGPGPGGPPAALGHRQRPDRLHVAVPGLGFPRRSPRQRGPGRFDCVEWIRLALTAPHQAVGPVDLHHGDVGRSQRSGHADAIGAGAFDTDEHHGAERLKPGQQAPVTAGVGGELLDTEQSADVVERSGNVQVQMGVHAAGHGAGGFYDGHCRPFLLMVKGWHAASRDGGD